MQSSLVILRLFSSLVMGQEKRLYLCQAALNAAFHGAQPVIGDGRPGRERQPVGLSVSALVAAVRPDERRI